MARRILFLAIIGLIIKFGIYSSLTEVFHRQRILRSTVMITITVPEIDAKPKVDEALPIPPDEYRSIVRPDSYIASKGLGTLVNIDGEMMLVTHDHWSLLDNSLGIVQISNASGHRLAEIQLLQFKKLIRYRDGGTMVLQVPKEIKKSDQIKLSWLASDSLTNQPSVSGEPVLLVYRQRDGANRIAIMEATVEKLGAKQGKPIIRLQSGNGEAIIGGDSGGGVWLSGNLVGNMWTTVVKEDIGTGFRRQTETSIAALYPGTINSEGEQGQGSISNWIASVSVMLSPDSWRINEQGI